jgi:hypothetical protein
MTAYQRSVAKVARRYDLYASRSRRRNHLHVTTSEGALIATVSGTPANSFWALRNFEADLRRWARCR